MVLTARNRDRLDRVGTELGAATVAFDATDFIALDRFFAGPESASTTTPWYGVRHGKDGVIVFFQAFGSTMDVEEFTPISFAGNDNDVLTAVRLRASARATGKSVAMDLHHYFVFADGRIVYYRGTEDTAQTLAALQP